MISLVLIQEEANKELLDKCILSIKAEKCTNGKAVLVGGAGLSKAELLNKGIELSSKAEYVVFINNYEELQPGFIQKCLNIFSRYPVGAVYTDFEKDGIRNYLPSFSRSGMTQGQLIPTTAMYKAEALAICGGFDTNIPILENWDMWLRISERFPLYHIPECLYTTKNRNNELSITDIEQSKKYILEKVIQRKNGN